MLFEHLVSGLTKDKHRYSSAVFSSFSVITQRGLNGDCGGPGPPKNPLFSLFIIS
jgi:hypothetical protein